MKTTKSSPHQFIFRCLCPCCVPLFLCSHTNGNWVAYFEYYSIYVRPKHSSSSHQPSVPPLTPVTICCCHRQCCDLYEKERFFPQDLVQDSSQKYFQPARTDTNITPFFFSPIVSSRSQVRYTHTKKTNEGKTLKWYSFLPEREKVKPDADSYVSTACLLYLLMVIKPSNTIMLSRTQPGYKHQRLIWLETQTRRL